MLYTLNDAGYQAFIVGGAVRDLLLGKTPKDFDVATDATPEQVKTEFRRARIIGRRFRIVHVVMGREIIEVSTFRASNTDSLEIKGERLARNVRHVDSAHSNSGMILRDNVYGTLEEDVVSEMKPYVSGKTVSTDVKPVINNLHNASSLTDATTRLAPKISK